MTNQVEYNFRKAKLSDSVKLDELIIQSSQSINNTYYTEKIVNAAIGSIWIVDEQLISDGTYWLAENKDNKIVGCGGWSKRSLLFGNDAGNDDSELEELIPGKDSARIRAFFIHPDFTRQGIGKELLKICQEEAKFYGFTSLELVATLSGEKLYKAYGFQEKKRLQLDLGDGVLCETVEMNKTIG